MTIQTLTDTCCIPGVRSSGDLSAAYGKVGNFDANGRAQLCTSGRPEFIIGNKPTLLDEPVVAIRCQCVGEVAMDGTTDIAIGDPLKGDGSGNLIKATGAGDTVIAWALEACTTNGVELHAASIVVPHLLGN